MKWLVLIDMWMSLILRVVVGAVCLQSSDKDAMGSESWEER
jgi:hypothetical protein